MKTIKWLVSQLPQSVRTLFAVLLIAIATLATVVVNLYKGRDKDRAEYELAIKQLVHEFKIEKDSLTQELFNAKAENKKEAIESLERIIEQQKELLEEQKIEGSKQEKIKKQNNKNINAIKGLYVK